MTARDSATTGRDSATTGQGPATSGPVVARTRAELGAARARLRAPVVLVPTLGALHEGHVSLLRAGRRFAGPGGSVLVSIFVNPLQFGPAEDFDQYPRPLERDLEICGQEGASAVFVPGDREMYPAPPQVTVDPGPVGRILEGEFRPGFFTGVLTVVLKLLQRTRPQVAGFGEKDAQQLLLIRQMVTDLNLDVRIEPVPTHRDRDGLATSSRNRYLSAAERATALALPRALSAATADAADGPKAALAAATARLDEAAAADPPLRPDYLALADPATFAPIDAGSGHRGPALLLVAARVGGTRLIDNTSLTFGDGGGRAAGTDGPP